MRYLLLAAAAAAAYFIAADVLLRFLDAIDPDSDYDVHGVLSSAPASHG
jgi:hypothetical protein